MCETDYSGYPDCRDNTMKAMQLALSLGMDKRFLIDTPLMWIDKADTWRMARALYAAANAFADQIKVPADGPQVLSEYGLTFYTAFSLLLEQLYSYQTPFFLLVPRRFKFEYSIKSLKND